MDELSKNLKEKEDELDVLSKELKEKEDELGKMQSHTNTLIVKDRESNAMLQEARSILEKVCCFADRIL